MNLLQFTLLAAHEDWVYTKGWIVTIAGFLIVIIALFILSAIFRGVANYFIKQDEKKSKVDSSKSKVESPKLSTPNPQLSTAKGEIAPEVLTAIGMALYLSTNLHDEESNVITIDRRVTSWNDKNYGVRHWKR